jgi:hypothetical protein
MKLNQAKLFRASVLSFNELRNIDIIDVKLSLPKVLTYSLKGSTYIGHRSRKGQEGKTHFTRAAGPGHRRPRLHRGCSLARVPSKNIPAKAVNVTVTNFWLISIDYAMPNQS